MKEPDPKDPYYDRHHWHGCRSSVVRAKSIMAMPHRILIEAIDAGWICRNDIIWHKLSAVPSSAKDRLTPTYEHLFLLTKSPRYYFDLDEIRIPHKGQAAEPFNRRARDMATGRGMGADGRTADRERTEADAAYGVDGVRRPESDTRQVQLDAPDQTAPDPRVLRALQRRSVRYDARVGDGDAVIVPARAQPMRTTNRIPGNPSDNPAMLKADGTPFNHPAGKNPGDVVAQEPDMAFRPQNLNGVGGIVQKGKRGEKIHVGGTLSSNPAGKNPGDVIGMPDITPKAVQTIRDHYGNAHPDGTPINHPGGKNPGDVQAFRPQPLRVNMTTHDGRQVNANGEPYEDPRGKNPGDVQEFRRTFSNHGEFVHVATFPESLAAWCLRAGCPKGGMVLDPFFGSGTVGVAAEKLGREWCGIELSAVYIDEARRRLAPYANDRLAPLKDEGE